ncbi:MAG TPA: maleylpyruvate isomerase family mycothiol-dependent enzyme [Nocardioides sp.]|uniref:maleylpyruvate isomerase family mycothiol-dependent enzyme n=1 Tax=Nocardioides sp. TaxID=35761 RepID=UPI002E315158|nr:maleylpyruvate isomerase family mycothiol-dependent enzyme [Nocardioides sp.]HEX3929604.1 maleylpyruvate isomerase family mycothiol-dependent enzyme [Nocardioides sp.]
MTTDHEQAADRVGAAAGRLLRTVDGLAGGGWEAPTLLPDWSRAHLVAHLALNAEALTRLLHGVVAEPDDDVPRTMYDSDEQRAQDIETLAAAGPTEIRDHLLAATTTFADAVAAVPPDGWETRVERTPGGRTMRVASVPGMRLRELEIHHVDLHAGYATSDWSPAFAEHLVDAMTRRLHPARGFEIRPVDSSRAWVVGAGESEYPVPVVSGPAADVGWWLTGRVAPDSVSCSHGELPAIEGW